MGIPALIGIAVQTYRSWDMKMHALMSAVLVAFAGTALAQTPPQAPVKGTVKADREAVKMDKAAVKADKAKLKVDQDKLKTDKGALKVDQDKMKADVKAAKAAKQAAPK
jgi:hypothetical protein